MNSRARILTAWAAIFLWQCQRIYCFHMPPTTTSPISTSTTLFGGYEMFSDPTTAIDKSQTHMIFGTRCNEVPTQLPDGRLLVGLRPTDSTEQYNYGQALVNCISQQPDLLVAATIVELGVSTFALAAKAMGAAQVVVCHADETRLRQVEYASQFLNGKVLSSTAATPLATKLLRLGEPLPYLDTQGTTIVAFTMEDDTSDKSSSDRMAEAFQLWNPQYMLIPSPLVPESQLATFQAQYPEVGGIFVVSA